MWRLAEIGVRFIIVAFVSQSAVLVGTRLIQTGEARDPLAPYEAILPGQPLANLEGFSCNWFTEYFEDRRMGVCGKNWDDTFVSANVTVNHVVVQRLSFRVSNQYVGDLVLRWGRPIIRNEAGFYSAQWYRGGYVVRVPLSRRFSYSFPVRYLYVEISEESGSS